MASKLKKRLKSRRAQLSSDARGYRKALARLIEKAKVIETGQRPDVLDQIQVIAARLQSCIDEREAVDGELKSLPKPNPSRKKRVHKVHQISGREVDPLGFRGVVSGGLPNGGKRR